MKRPVADVTTALISLSGSCGIILAEFEASWNNDCDVELSEELAGSIDDCNTALQQLFGGPADNEVADHADGLVNVGPGELSGSDASHSPFRRKSYKVSRSTGTSVVTTTLIITVITPWLALPFPSS